MRMIVQEEALRRTEGHWVHHIIHELPTIDAVPVVRCKDCIHRGYDACPMRHEDAGYDEDGFWYDRTVDNTEDDGFCHKGAKMDAKEDDHATD